MHKSVKALTNSYVLHNILLMNEVSASALLAIRSWLRLEQAFTAYNRDLQHTFGVTGSQLAMLRIVHELEPITLAELRKQLTMHPATLGQLIERLTKQGLVKTTRSNADRRLRQVVVSSRGLDLLAQAPLAGPVRLRAREFVLPMHSHPSIPATTGKCSVSPMTVAGGLLIRCNPL